MSTLILITLLISFLILVHEWGHFYSARRFGVRVEEFGFGFPPRLFSRIKNGVRYSFNLFPIGGYVKIFGEHGEGEGEKESFAGRPVWQRFVILFAGVFMNLLAAWFFFSVGSVFGIPGQAADHDTQAPVSIITVLPGSPAEEAGLRLGDQILELKSPDIALTVRQEQDVRDFIDAYRGEEIVLVVRRAGAIKEISAEPRLFVPEGEGPLGIAMARLTITPAPWHRAPWEGLKILFRSLFTTLEGFGALFWQIITKGVPAVPVSGPVGIFFFAQDTQSLGIAYFLQFVGIISVNLAILNFLPIPALDGGRVLFLAIEKIRGSRMDPKIENAIHAFGFIALILLMIFVTYKDVVRVL